MTSIDYAIAFEASSKMPEWALREFCRRAQVPFDRYTSEYIDQEMLRLIYEGARLIAHTENEPIDTLGQVIREAWNEAWEETHRDGDIDLLDRITSAVKKRLTPQILEAMLSEVRS